MPAGGSESARGWDAREKKSEFLHWQRVSLASRWPLKGSSRLRNSSRVLRVDCCDCARTSLVVLHRRCEPTVHWHTVTTSHYSS